MTHKTTIPKVKNKGKKAERLRLTLLAPLFFLIFAGAEHKQHHTISRAKPKVSMKQREKERDKLTK